MSVTQVFNQAVAQDLAGDMPDAIRLYREAADAGHPIACYNLGVCLEHGDGLTQDMALATVYYGRAAEAGYAPAQLRMALLQPDMAGRRRWLGAAAAQDLPAAVALYEQDQDYPFNHQNTPAPR